MPTDDADDSHILEWHEVVSIVRGHGQLLLPESAPSTRAEGARALPRSCCGAVNGLVRECTGLVVKEECVVSGHAGRSRSER